jgi:periplasmic protein TonB
MFSENLLDSSGSRSSALKPRRWLIGVAVIFEAAIAGAVALSPFVSVAALPETVAVGKDYFPPIPAGGGNPAQVSRSHRAAPASETTRTLVIPVNVPNVIAPDVGVTPAAPSPQGIIGDAMGSGGPGAGPGIGFPGGTQIFAVNVPPPPKPAATPRVRIGGTIEEARLVFGPKPDYPQLARMARVEGTVRLEAVISKDGTVGELKVLNGNPLLIPAALEAVARWRYRPTLLNGEPVEVLTEVDINFKLGE